jgi:hypothetical protein
VTTTALLLAAAQARGATAKEANNETETGSPASRARANAPVAANRPAAPAAGASAQDDVTQTLRQVAASLEALAAGRQPEGGPIDGLFSVDFADAGAMHDRVRVLDDDLRRLEAQQQTMRDEQARLAREPPGGELEADAEREAQAAMEAQLARINRGLDEITLQLRVARHRREYLDAAAQLIDSLPGPARTALATWQGPRAAMRGQITGVRRIASSAEALAGRLDTVHAAAMAGSLVGFAADRERAAQRLTAGRDDLRARTATITTAAGRLDEAVASIEHDAASLRQAIFATVLSQAGAGERDDAFTRHVRLLRELRRRAGERQTLGDLDTGALVRQLDGGVADPSQVGSTKAALDAADQAIAWCDDLDRLLARAEGSALHWRLAFEREAVTVLDALASEQAKNRAYALSTELLQDTRAEILLAGDRASGWAAGWLDRLKAGPSATHVSFILRLLACLALVAVAWLTRKSQPRLIGKAVRIASSALEGRVSTGAIVRWAGLAQAVLPILILGAAVYAGSWVVGFQHIEIAFLEVILRWWLLYLLGRQLLLGATRRITRSRPALVEASPATVALLRLTYSRVGLVIVLGLMVDELSRRFLGLHTVQVLVDGLVLVFVAIWGVWAAVAWRLTMARAWRAKPNLLAQEARLAGFMERSRVGAVLSPIALFALTTRRAIEAVSRALSERGVLTYLRARSLRRRARQEGDAAASAAPAELPPEYLEEFPLHPVLGESDAVLVPRDALVEQVTSQYERWKATRADASIVILGEKGAGKTTLLELVARPIRDCEVVRHVLPPKTITEAAVVGELGNALGAPGAESIDALAAHVANGGPRIVLLDEAHNTFLRIIDGHRGLDALVRLVNATAESTFWILVFNTFAWEFINASRGHNHYFRRLLELPPWSADEIQDLIGRRNLKAGFELEFDEMLLDDERSTEAGFALIEGADGFFRMLWEASGGNPRVAIALWLQALRPAGERRLGVGLFRETGEEVLGKLTDDLWFALAAIAQHDNLSVAELQRVLNTNADLADFAVRFLLEKRLADRAASEPVRATLAPRPYRQVIRALRRKHLLWESH